MKKTYMIAFCLVGLSVAVLALCGADLGMTHHVTASLGHVAPMIAMAGMPAMREFGRKDDKSVDDDAAEIGDLTKEIAKLRDETKTFAEDVIKKVKAGNDASGELKEKADKALSEGAELKTTLTARLDELEQKLAARRGGSNAEQKSAGQFFTSNEDVKAFMAARKSRGSVKVELKAITSASNSGGALVPEDRRPGIIGLPERRMTVRDLLTPGRTNSNAVQYVRESGFTNAADVVSEGTQKPESALTFELKNVPVATIAHWVQASKQILDDAPMLESYIDGRLRYGLAYKEEIQLLKGDGTGENLTGILTQATAYSAPFSISGETMIDTLRLALLQAELAEYPSTGIVLNPSDWARIELAKDEFGRYIIGNPQGTTQPSLWNRPVVATQAMDVDDFLTGAFKLGAQVFDREDANVEISTEDGTNFIKNLVTIRGEERLALTIYRDEAFVYGDFGNVSG